MSETLEPTQLRREPAPGGMWNGANVTACAVAVFALALGTLVFYEVRSQTGALADEVAALKRALAEPSKAADAPARDTRVSPLQKEVEELATQVKDLEKASGVKDPFLRDSRSLAARLKALETEVAQLRQKR